MTTERASRPGTRILIVDDHAVFREGLKMLLAQDSALTVVAEAGDAQQAVTLAATTQPDIILLDVDLAGFDGLQILGALQTAAPSGAVIVMTGVRADDLQARALRLGARGFVAKEHSAELVLRAIRRVREGELWFDRGTVSTVVSRFLRDEPEAADSTAEPLTQRERDIVRLVGEGLKNDGIAKRLAISEKTVRNNLTVIYEKVGVSDRLHLALYAYRHGLAKLPF
jgi:DNA-binding NarL/FixJ family response regulator